MILKKPKWQWVIVAVGILIAARQGASVWRLYKTGEQVGNVAGQLHREEEENLDLKRRLAEIDTPEFIEREARDKLGYSREGETILVLPKQNEVDSLQLTVDGEPNWQQWWELYIRI